MPVWTCRGCQHYRSLDPVDPDWGTCIRVSRPDHPLPTPMAVVVVDGLLETAELLVHGDTFFCQQFTRRLRMVVPGGNE